MELFKLFGTIAINNSDANRALDETANKGQQTQGKLSKFFSGVGKGAAKVGKAVGIGLGVGATAMTGLTVKAMQAAGSLEQNMGGSEAVFGKYADKMQGKAKSAYSSMGLSTNDYLQTANKMGSLFKGAGFETSEAMDLTSKAMQRASDVASIMGIDTSMAMESIAGAAKGNFTMMDNLGVAMNDTTLQAYALEKGIKKSTQEMTNQEKIGLAMEMFLEKTADYAGNYSKENETLAGSLGTAKAAFQNFLDGSGDVDSLVKTFSGAINSMVRQLDELLPRLVSGLTDLVNQLIPMLPPLIQKVLPVIVEGATSLINGVVDVLPQLLDALIGALPLFIDGVTQIFNGIIEALPQLIQAIVNALPTLIPQLIDGFVSLVVTICEQFSSIIQPIIDALPDIIISIVEALMNNLPALIEGVIALVMGIVEALPQIIQALVDAMPTIITLVIEGLLNALPQLIAGIVQVVSGIVAAIPQIFSSLVEAVVNVWTGVWEAIKKVFGDLPNWFNKQFKQGAENAKTAWKTITNFFKNIWDGIKKIFSKLGSWFGDQFKQGKENAQKAWSTVVNFFKNVWSGIKKAFSAVGSFFKNQFEQGKKNAQQAWSTVKDFFSNIWSGIKNVFASVGSWFRNIFTSAKNGVQNAWSGVKNFFSNIKNGIVNAFSNIKEKLTAPFTKARDAIKKVADKIKGFFKGNISMPKIKIPKFSIKPAGWEVGDLLKGSIPKLSITWAAKGGIFDEPTLFNTPTGMLGVGEAGAEAVAPIDTLMGYVQTAVQAETGGLVTRFDRLLDMLAKYFPEMLTAANKEHPLDTNALAKRLAPAMNVRFNEMSRLNARGAL